MAKKKKNENHSGLTVSLELEHSCLDFIHKEMQEAMDILEAVSCTIDDFAKFLFLKGNSGQMRTISIGNEDSLFDGILSAYGCLVWTGLFPYTSVHSRKESSFFITLEEYTKIYNSINRIKGKPVFNMNKNEFFSILEKIPEKHRNKSWHALSMCKCASI